ncbi:MAG: hypothetical protein HYR60_09440 [Acidobacteria bacterium]|nr:hypothetical protein [Acidobacteriota bacterium]
MGGIASQALGGILGGGGGGGPLGQIGGLLKNTLGKLFGKKHKHHHHCAPKPLPFRPQCCTNNTNINVNNNLKAPLQAFRGLGQQLSQIANTLSQILGQLQQGGGPGGNVAFPKLPPITTAPGGPGLPGGLNTGDLIKHAGQSFLEGTPEGQMKAQELMQKAAGLSGGTARLPADTIQDLRSKSDQLKARGQMMLGSPDLEGQMKGQELLVRAERLDAVVSQWGGPAGGASDSVQLAGGGPGSSIPVHQNLDQLMADAQKDASDGTMEGALKAQQNMQKAMRTFELLSKLMENQSQMQSKAIAAMR